MSTKNHSGDKRGGFVPLDDIAGAVELPNGRALTPAAPQALHHFTRLDQIDQLVDASEADADLGFMARLLALCSLPRRTDGLTTAERTELTQLRRKNRRLKLERDIL